MKGERRTFGVLGSCVPLQLSHCKVERLEMRCVRRAASSDKAFDLSEYSHFSRVRFDVFKTA